MGARPDPLAQTLIDAVTTDYTNHPRSLQKTIGVSEIGQPCDRMLAYKARQPALPVKGGKPEIWPAYVGTAVHKSLAKSLARDNNRYDYPRWIIEAPVLPHPVVRGESDLYYIPTETVVDHKIQGVEAHRKSKKGEMKTVYHVQLQTYGLGHEAIGRKVKDVALAAWPKGGRSQDLTIIRRPYQRSVAENAIDRWLRLSTTDKLPWEVQATPEDGDCQYCPFYRPGATGPDGCPGIK
jgi:hypothetical protein